ncbi:MAG TPA: ammonium transporter [Thermoplasmata archaeon]|nr:ammonium transporter [Thermoplasmata archaeon]
MFGDPVNNLWVIVAGLLVFTMTIAVGLLEVGELGEALYASLMKTVLMTCLALFVMAIVGFNTAFAPTIGGGVIGNPFYRPGLFLGSFAASPATAPGTVWWSMAPAGFNTGLDTGTYFLFETAFAAVTLALVGVVVLRKMKLVALGAYSIVYFVLIWNLPAAWIWNPTGWLAKLGMVDFAGGLVVHGAAGAAGLGLLYQFWREERAKGLTASPQATIQVSPGWLTLAILLLWVGWFGFNPGSVLAFNDETTVVVLTTFLAAASAMLSVLAFRHILHVEAPTLLDGTNGILMGLIVITPVAGFVSPASAIVLGILGGPIFLLGEKYFAKWKWMSDPVGLLPGHLVGGLFGVAMIAFFAEPAYSGALPGYPGLPSLPAGLLFGGGTPALHQLGIEMFGVVAVMVTVFVLSFVTAWVLARLLGGITTDYRKEGILP